MSTYALRQYRLRAISHIVNAASWVLATAFLSSAAQATTMVSPGSSVTAVAGGSPGAYTLTYNIYNGKDTNEDLDAITEIDIPELDSGDLVFVNLPTGWYASELSNGPFTVDNPKDANQSAYYIQLFADTDETFGIGYEDTVSFVAQVPTSNTVNATFALVHNVFAYDAYSESFDPPIPAPSSTTTVPEPSTMTMLGLGLLALSATKRRGDHRQKLR